MIFPSDRDGTLVAAYVNFVGHDGIQKSKPDAAGSAFFTPAVQTVQYW
jgi:hypothetical protein